MFFAKILQFVFLYSLISPKLFSCGNEISNIASYTKVWTPGAARLSLDPKKGEGLFILPFEENLNDHVFGMGPNEVLSQVSELLLQGSKQFRLQLLLQSGGRNRSRDIRKFIKLFGPHSYERLVALFRKARDSVNYNLPEGGAPLRIIQSDVRFVKGFESSSSYLHYDYYKDDYIVILISFYVPKKQGTIVFPSGPKGPYLILPQNHMMAFTAIDRLVQFVAKLGTAEQKERLRELDLFQAGKTRDFEGVYNEIASLMEDTPGVIPTMHQANQGRSDRVVSQIVLGR